MPAADPVPGWARNIGRCDNMAAAADRLCAMMERSGRKGRGWRRADKRASNLGLRFPPQPLDTFSWSSTSATTLAGAPSRTMLVATARSGEWDPLCPRAPTRSASGLTASVTCLELMDGALAARPVGRNGALKPPRPPRPPDNVPLDGAARVGVGRHRPVRLAPGVPHARQTSPRRWREGRGCS